MDRIRQLSARIQHVREQVQEMVDEPWLPDFLEILDQLLLAVEAFPSLESPLAEVQIARAESLLSSQIADLQDKILPPRPPNASEAAILDRKADLVRLLDLRASDDTLIDEVVDLAREATRNGDDLTFYALTSGPLDLYYKARQVDSSRVHERILWASAGIARARAFGTLRGPAGVAALSRDVLQTMREMNSDGEIRGTFVRSQTDLAAAASFPWIGPDDLTSEDDLSSEDREEIAAIEEEFRRVALIVGELEAAKVESAGALGPFALLSPPSDPPGITLNRLQAAKPGSLHEAARLHDVMLAREIIVSGDGVAYDEVAKKLRGGLVRLRQAEYARTMTRTSSPLPIRLLLLLGSLLLAVPIHLAFGWPQIAAPTSPTASAIDSSPVVSAPLRDVVGDGPARALRSLTIIPSPTFVLPTTTPKRDVRPTEIPLGNPTVAPPTPLPELRVGAHGFGQDQQKVGYAFLVKNASRVMVTDRTHYVVTAFDAANNVVATAWGDIGVVLPLQQQGVAGTFIDPGDSSVSRIEVKLEVVAFRPPWTNRPLPLSTAALTFHSDATSSSVSAEVINPSSTAFGSAVVNAVAYNSQGKIIGGGSIDMGPLAANVQAPVDLSVTTSARPTRIDLYAAPSSIPPTH